MATLDDVTRFPDAKQARAYLGLVPTEYSSGRRQQRGRINKAGPNRARHLLVEAAWSNIASAGSPMPVMLLPKAQMSIW